MEKHILKRVFPVLGSNLLSTAGPLRWRSCAAIAMLAFLNACANLPAAGVAENPATKPQSNAATPQGAAANGQSAGQPQASPTQAAMALKAVAQAQSDAAQQDAASKLISLETVQAPSLAIQTVDLPADIWERMRRGFAMPELNVDEVSLRQQWYAQRGADFYRIAERSNKYLYYILEEIERRGMPAELALLPFVESAFNPHAYSRAKAAGMWQFIPSTGKYYSLTQNAFRDDRRDVLASTRAALDYLGKLYAMFGDWHLALAAYNWGEGSVGRAIARNQAKGLGTSYADLPMPKETAQYVPKLLALKNLVQKPDDHGLKLPPIPNHPYFQSVNISRDIDVSVAARLAEVQIEDIKSLNPSINRPVILAAGNPQLLLPWDNAEVFERNLRTHTGPLASWTAWVTPIALKPAEAAKAAGMPELDFRTINNVTGRVIIKAGSSLLVPRRGANQSDVAAHVADNGQVNLQSERAPAVRARPQARTANAVRSNVSATKSPARSAVRKPVVQARSTKAPNNTKLAARPAPKPVAKAVVKPKT
jgi:membrane-bound lytic murein transglycosylase D